MKSSMNKTKTITVMFAMLCVGVLAQTNTNSVPVTDAGTVSFQGWLVYIIPFLAPIGVATFKYFIPKIPKVLLPVLAPILGIAIDQLVSLSPGYTANPAFAALLGASGVMLREALDQTKKLIPKTDDTNT